MDEIEDMKAEEYRRWKSLVLGGDKKALRIVVKAWKGHTVREAAQALKVTQQTLHNWRDRIPELEEMLK